MSTPTEPGWHWGREHTWDAEYVPYKVVEISGKLYVEIGCSSETSGAWDEPWSLDAITDWGPRIPDPPVPTVEHACGCIERDGVTVEKGEGCE